ncbi:MAG TPA: EAL domain-containing protein, partial [Acidimicrobiales bacterium]|nr:EAL domain-containing protein [Acidimicrobiales bacterium]
DEHAIVARTSDVQDDVAAHLLAPDFSHVYRSIVESAREAICTIDGEGVITFANESMGELAGLAPAILVGQSIANVVDGQIARVASTRRAASYGARCTQVELCVTRRDGTEQHVIVSVSPIRDDSGDGSAPSPAPSGNRSGSVIVVLDVTRLRRSEEEIARAALFDSVTGLANRSLFLDRVDQALRRSARREGGRPVVVLTLDLDGFNTINDSLGRDAGDVVLQVMSQRLLESVRSGDTVARLEGDKYAVLCESVGDEEGARALAVRFGEVIRRPVDLPDRSVVLTSCIGIALSPPPVAGSASDGPTMEGDASATAATTLLRDAVTALHRAKERGRANVETFDEGVRVRALTRLEWESDLRSAIEREEFLLHYQPTIAVDDGGIVGVEALVRWRRRDGRLVAPAEFIPLAEQTGMVSAIDAWVLREACRQVAAWSRRSRPGRPLELSVNISGRHLADPELIAHVESALNRSGLSPHLLTLEMTESVLMTDDPATHGMLRSLKALGVRLGVDDFGTGYSSLLYLRQFPFDVIKIDRSFVSGLGTDAEDGAIVEGVIGLAHALGLPATAEGVESAVQLDKLRSLGCDLAQGFLVGRPAPAEELAAILHDEASV